QKAGASAVIIHGRTKEQGYSGSANLNIIKNIKEKLNIPVIVNGDIKDLQAFKNAKEMGFNSIMIGRGALGRPFIFREIKKNQNKLTKKNIKKAFKRHFKYLKSEYHEKYIVNSLKKHVARYLTGLDNASTIKRKALRLDRSADIYKTVIKFLNN
ncbi:MAG: tRNA-dihydrouridine synthase, partial [archaeon]